ncbi:MAG: phosphoribosylanthranilate isomerase [Lachnospiraceae bacterium]|nr:phosphoribosylanthranilate isomerase [Lachnospiraceae bacterium]
MSEKTKIKICGLSRPIDIDYVNEAKPDLIGFIINFPKSIRNIDPNKAKELKALLDPGIKAVGVFVDEKAEVIAKLANEKTIDLIQLHGKEDEAFVHRLKQLTHAPIIKAFKGGMVTEEDLITFPADYVLIDSGKGSGKTFDWSTIPKSPKPWFLAGGIGMDNVEEAIKTLHPDVIDLSSSVESDGVKDKDKILEIVRRIRNV